MFRLKNRRKSDRATVDQIVGSLMKIKEELETLNDEKNNHITRLNSEKESIDSQIKDASLEKERGSRIFKNIQQLVE